MIRRLERQQATFDEFVEEMQAKPEIRTLRHNVVFYQNSDRYRDATPEAERDLKKLMKRLDLVNARQNSDIYMELDENPFNLHFEGFRSIAKGYAYLDEPPHPNFLAESLTLDLENEGDGITYRHVKGNWYLYFDVTNW